MLDKLAAGDRAFAAGDLRGALFAYQDATYAQPDYPFARVKLGRAYLALRYTALALAQAEQALALDPANPDARRLAEEARNPPPRAPEPASPAPVVVSPPSGSAPRIYRLPEPEPAPVASAPPPHEDGPAAEPEPAAPPPQRAAGPSAAQRYRTAVDLMGRREFAGAVAELDQALAQDPRLAVAYAARASAKFGLGRTRDAAEDYRVALALDPGLATPLYGLAECYRLLGDPAAAEMYQRYAQSSAADVREDLRAVAASRARELSGR